MQVQDDPKLLKLMLDDTLKSPDLFKPTNYWAYYEKKFVPELKKYGLKDFRRRRNSALSSFGASDLNPSFGQIDLFNSNFFYNHVTRRIPGWTKLLMFWNSKMERIFPVGTKLKVEDLKQLAYDFTKLAGEKAGAKSLTDFEASMNGSPEDVFQDEDGRKYTTSILYYYLRYAYCCQYVNFDEIETLVELGSGSGKQVEVTKKLHPNVTFLLFDIPPQLYVCEQYLKSIFPDDVISYRQTREMKTLADLEKGKIYIFGNWKFPIITTRNFDLFWNAASLHEMEPHIVANYLKFVNPHANSAYLQEVMTGKEMARKEGDFGVIKQTKLEDYEKGLSDFKMVDMSVPIIPHGRMDWYSDSFWKRRS